VLLPHISHKNVVFLSHTHLPFCPNITKNTHAVNKFIDWCVFELNMVLVSFSSLAITGSSFVDEIVFIAALQSEQVP
jgi:hypothetical protein